jgi:hypothetical protein
VAASAGGMAPAEESLGCRPRADMLHVEESFVHRCLVDMSLPDTLLVIEAILSLVNTVAGRSLPYAMRTANRLG